MVRRHSPSPALADNRHKQFRSPKSEIVEMKSYPRSTIALTATAIVAVVLLWVLFSLDLTDPTWVPQTVVTLAGLVGASWFAGNRLDLFDKDIHQRQAFADHQLGAAERANFNSAVKEAVEMMSSQSPSTVLAGQRWLHTIAEVGASRSEASSIAPVQLCGQRCIAGTARRSQ